MEQATAFCSRMEMARMLCGREGFASQTRPNRSRRRKANPQDSPARRDRIGLDAAKRIRRIRQLDHSDARRPRLGE
jgi:hypothetical protein